MAGCAQLGGSPAAAPAIETDVARLVAAAKRLNTAWPWQAEIPEVALVARHGVAAAPALVAELRYSSEEQWGTEGWSLHVEQQVELALCRIFGVEPESGRTVFGIRSSEAQNRQVLEYWRAKVASSRSDAQPAHAAAGFFAAADGRRWASPGMRIAA